MLLWIGVGRGGCGATVAALGRPSYRPGGGAVDCVGGAAVLSFCDGPWRIRVLAGSGEFFCPSLAFSGDGTAAGAMSGEDSGRLA